MGWQVSDRKLTPVKLKGSVVPDSILSVVCCQCRKKCSSTARSCRKHGLLCISACSRCRGIDCTNVRIVTSDDGSSCDSLPVELVEPMQQVEVIWDEDVDCLFKEEV